MAVYVIKFDTPLGNPNKPRAAASYYIGHAPIVRVSERLAEHRAGRGASITRAAVERGIGFQLVAVFEGDRAVERRMKNNGHFAETVARWTARGLNLLAGSV